MSNNVTTAVDEVLPLASVGHTTPKADNTTSSLELSHIAESSRGDTGLVDSAVYTPKRTSLTVAAGFQPSLQQTSSTVPTIVQDSNPPTSSSNPSDQPGPGVAPPAVRCVGGGASISNSEYCLSSAYCRACEEEVPRAAWVAHQRSHVHQQRLRHGRKEQQCHGTTESPVEMVTLRTAQPQQAAATATVTSTLLVETPSPGPPGVRETAKQGAIENNALTDVTTSSNLRSDLPQHSQENSQRQRFQSSADLYASPYPKSSTTKTESSEYSDDFEHEEERSHTVEQRHRATVSPLQPTTQPSQWSPSAEHASAESHSVPRNSSLPPFGDFLGVPNAALTSVQPTAIDGHTLNTNIQVRAVELNAEQKERRRAGELEKQLQTYLYRKERKLLAAYQRRWYTAMFLKVTADPERRYIGGSSAPATSSRSTTVCASTVTPTPAATRQDKISSNEDSRGKRERRKSATGGASSSLSASGPTPLFTSQVKTYAHVHLTSDGGMHPVRARNRSVADHDHDENNTSASSESEGQELEVMHTDVRWVMKPSPRTARSSSSSSFSSSFSDVGNDALRHSTERLTSAYQRKIAERAKKKDQESVDKPTIRKDAGTQRGPIAPYSSRKPHRCISTTSHGDKRQEEERVAHHATVETTASPPQRSNASTQVTSSAPQQVSSLPCSSRPREDAEHSSTADVVSPPTPRDANMNALAKKQEEPQHTISRPPLVLQNTLRPDTPTPAEGTIAPHDVPNAAVGCAPVVVEDGGDSSHGSEAAQVTPAAAPADANATEELEQPEQQLRGDAYPIIREDDIDHDEGDESAAQYRTEDSGHAPQERKHSSPVASSTSHPTESSMHDTLSTSTASSSLLVPSSGASASNIAELASHLSQEAKLCVQKIFSGTLPAAAATQVSMPKPSLLSSSTPMGTTSLFLTSQHTPERNSPPSPQQPTQFLAQCSPSSRSQTSRSVLSCSQGAPSRHSYPSSVPATAENLDVQSQRKILRSPSSATPPLRFFQQEQQQQRPVSIEGLLSPFCTSTDEKKLRSSSVAEHLSAVLDNEETHDTANEDAAAPLPSLEDNPAMHSTTQETHHDDDGHHEGHCHRSHHYPKLKKSRLPKTQLALLVMRAHNRSAFVPLSSSSVPSAEFATATQNELRNEVSGDGGVKENASLKHPYEIKVPTFRHDAQSHEMSTAVGLLYSRLRGGKRALKEDPHLTQQDGSGGDAEGYFSSLPQKERYDMPKLIKFAPHIANLVKIGVQDENATGCTDLLAEGNGGNSKEDVDAEGREEQPYGGNPVVSASACQQVLDSGDAPSSECTSGPSHLPTHVDGKAEQLVKTQETEHLSSQGSLQRVHAAASEHSSTKNHNASVLQGDQYPRNLLAGAGDKSVMDLEYSGETSADVKESLAAAAPTGFVAAYSSEDVSKQSSAPSPALLLPQSLVKPCAPNSSFTTSSTVSSGAQRLPHRASVSNASNVPNTSLHAMNAASTAGISHPTSTLSDRDAGGNSLGLPSVHIPLLSQQNDKASSKVLPRPARSKQLRNQQSIAAEGLRSGNSSHTDKKLQLEPTAHVSALQPAPHPQQLDQVSEDTPASSAVPQEGASVASVSDSMPWGSAAAAVASWQPHPLIPANTFLSLQHRRRPSRTPQFVDADADSTAPSSPAAEEQYLSIESERRRHDSPAVVDGREEVEDGETSAEGNDGRVPTQVLQRSPNTPLDSDAHAATVVRRTRLPIKDNNSAISRADGFPFGVMSTMHPYSYQILPNNAAGVEKKKRRLADHTSASSLDALPDAAHDLVNSAQVFTSSSDAVSRSFPPFSLSGSAGVIETEGQKVRPRKESSRLHGRSPPRNAPNETVAGGSSSLPSGDCFEHRRDDGRRKHHSSRRGRRHDSRKLPTQSQEERSPLFHPKIDVLTTEKIERDIEGSEAIADGRDGTPQSRRREEDITERKNSHRSGSRHHHSASTQHQHHHRRHHHSRRHSKRSPSPPSHGGGNADEEKRNVGVPVSAFPPSKNRFQHVEQQPERKERRAVSSRGHLIDPRDPRYVRQESALTPTIADYNPHASYAPTHPYELQTAFRPLLSAPQKDRKGLALKPSSAALPYRGGLARQAGDPLKEFGGEDGNVVPYERAVRLHTRVPHQHHRHRRCSSSLSSSSTRNDGKRRSSKVSLSDLRGKKLSKMDSLLGRQEATPSAVPRHSKDDNDSTTQQQRSKHNHEIPMKSVANLLVHEQFPFDNTNKNMPSKGKAKPEGRSEESHRSCCGSPQRRSCPALSEADEDPLLTDPNKRRHHRQQRGSSARGSPKSREPLDTDKVPSPPTSSEAVDNPQGLGSRDRPVQRRARHRDPNGADVQHEGLAEMALLSPLSSRLPPDAVSDVPTAAQPGDLFYMDNDGVYHLIRDDAELRSVLAAVGSPYGSDTRGSAPRPLYVVHRPLRSPSLGAQRIRSPSRVLPRRVWTITDPKNPLGCSRLNPYCSTCRMKYNLIFVDTNMRPLRWPSPKSAELEQMGDCRIHSGYIFGNGDANVMREASLEKTRERALHTHEWPIRPHIRPGQLLVEEEELDRPLRQLTPPPRGRFLPVLYETLNMDTPPPRLLSPLARYSKSNGDPSADTAADAGASSQSPRSVSHSPPFARTSSAPRGPLPQWHSSQVEKPRNTLHKYEEELRRFYLPSSAITFANAERQSPQHESHSSLPFNRERTEDGVPYRHDSLPADFTTTQPLYRSEDGCDNDAAPADQVASLKEERRIKKALKQLLWRDLPQQRGTPEWNRYLRSLSKELRQQRLL